MTQTNDGLAPESHAYLFGWDGKGWHDMVRLSSNQVTTIGRAPTNKIVLRDEVCSRDHCEIFEVRGEWLLRDLDSRNGTKINGETVDGDTPIESGSVIAIGDCRLALTLNPEVLPDPPSAGLEVADTTATGEPAILSRQHEVQLKSAGGAELAKLYKLGLQLGSARQRQELAEVVLTSLANETVADIAAILLIREGKEASPESTDLNIVAYHAQDENQPYHRLSSNLSDIVVRDREALLATDVSDTVYAVFDSLGELKAMSVICAPIQCGDRFHGLVHLYSMNPDNPLDENELNFTVAVADQTATAIDQLKEREQLVDGLQQERRQKQNLKEQLEVASEIIGDSEAIRQLRTQISLMAPTDATVLIRGDSGVGKELVARSIHLHSSRADGPLVCLNCAALNESILESELFGHEKGAFTGATDRKIGRFEQADGGTLFLDEIGEMSPAIQSKFLRVLEGHAFERVGGRRSVSVDVRVVAATNRDLEAAIEEGEFRSDLYFRLNVAELQVQPLKNRSGDIPLLAEFFLQKFTRKMGRTSIQGFTADAMNLLNEYSWPGNVRELQNTIERTVILCGNELVCADDIQLSRLNRKMNQDPIAQDAQAWRPRPIADIEREHILATLAHTEWNKSKASQLLGIERSTLDRKLKRYQVSRPT